MSNKDTNQALGTAIVTGGMRGIGRAIVLQLAKDGYDIATCFVHSEREVPGLVAEVEALGRRIVCRRCDVGDPDSVDGFTSAITEKLGPIEILVNNAGICKDRPLVMMKQQQWDDVIRTNLDSIYFFAKKVIYSMMKRKSGCIINISSVAGVYGNPGQTNYAAAKAGVIGFSKSLAKEVGPHGIRVNAVAPGWIETDMTKDLSKKAIEHVMPTIPLRRFGQATEVAELVSFLAKAKYVTAQVIQIDGGIVV